MNKELCFKFGTVSRLHSFKGEVAVYLDIEDPKQFNKLESIYIDINGKLVPFFISTFRVVPKGFALVKFRDINDEEAAKELLKKELYLPYDALPELEESQFYFYEVQGFTLVDNERGEIGIIEEVIDITHNPLLQVKSGEKEILIPLNFGEEPRIDRKEKKVYVSTPDGLIDLYLNGE